MFNNYGNIDDPSKINMLTKCIQIPEYIINFLLGCLGVLMIIWEIGVLLFVVLVDYITIFITGIGSFMYVIDVVILIIYFRNAKAFNKTLNE